MYIESLKKFIKYFGYRRRVKLVLFFLMSLIAGALEFLGVALIYPFVMLIVSPDHSVPFIGKQGISLLGSLSPVHFALLLGFSALVLFVVKNLYMILFLFVQSKFIQKWTFDINNRFMQFYLYAPYQKILKISNSEKLYVITTLSNQATSGFFIRVMNFVTNLSIVVLILGLILWKFPFAGIVSLLFIVVCVVCLNLFFKNKVKRLGKNIQQTYNVANNINYATVNNIKDIKIFCCEQKFYNDYGACGAKLADEVTLQTFYGGIPPYFVETLIVITLLLLGAVIAIQNISQSSVMVASFAMIVASIFRIAPALNRIQSALLNLPAGLNFVNALIEAYEKFGLADFEYSDYKKSNPLPFNDKIVFNDVCFSYDDKQVLQNVSFEIQKGDFVGIIGLSGAGKSTLADILTGLLVPDSGNIFVDDLKLDLSNRHDFRQNIGYVQQDLNVLERSFRENVAWGLPADEIDDERVSYLLNQVRLGEVIKSYADGIYAVPFIGDTGLSRGQKQRLAIARALYRNPEILIFDEATSALDVKVESDITDMLLSVCKDKTIIAIAHRLSTLRACNKLIYLKDGRIVDAGSFEYLEGKYPEFAELIRLSSLNK